MDKWKLTLKDKKYNELIFLFSSLAEIETFLDKVLDATAQGLSVNIELLEEEEEYERI